MNKDKYNILDVETSSLHLVKEVVLKTQKRWNIGKQLDLKQRHMSLKKQLMKKNWTTENTPTLVTINMAPNFYDEKEAKKFVAFLLKNKKFALWNKHTKFGIEVTNLKLSKTPKDIIALQHVKIEFDSMDELKSSLNGGLESIHKFVEEDMSSICIEIKKIEVHMRGSGILTDFVSIENDCAIVFNVFGLLDIRSFPLPWKEIKNQDLKSRDEEKMKTFLNNEGTGRVGSSSKGIHLYDGEAAFLLPTGCFMFDQRMSGLQIYIEFESLTKEERDVTRFDFQDYEADEESEIEVKPPKRLLRKCRKKRKAAIDLELSDDGEPSKNDSKLKELFTLQNEILTVVKDLDNKTTKKLFKLEELIREKTQGKNSFQSPKKPVSLREEDTLLNDMNEASNLQLSPKDVETLNSMKGDKNLSSIFGLAWKEKTSEE